MTTHEHSVELAGVNLAGRNHVCAFFNTKSNGGSINEPNMFEDFLGVQSTFCVP